MSREVRFSFDTEEQKKQYEALARSRGLTLSQLVKWCTFKYRADCVGGAEAMRAYRRRKNQAAIESEAGPG